MMVLRPAAIVSVVCKPSGWGDTKKVDSDNLTMGWTLESKAFHFEYSVIENRVGVNESTG